MINSRCSSCPSGFVPRSKSSSVCSVNSLRLRTCRQASCNARQPKALTIGAKRKDQDVPQQGQPPAKQISLPQGSSSSDWQPPYNPWEQSLQPDWEPYPVTAGDWQGEWAHSNPQVEEQAQLLWALSDQSVSRSRKCPLIQPKPSVPVKKKTDREVRFALSPDKDKGRPCPPTVDKTVESPPRKEKREETAGGIFR